MRVLDSFIKSLELEKPQSYSNMLITFLHRKNGRDHEVLNYDEALDAQLLDITEVGGQNAQPEVLFLNFKNNSAFPVFVPEGTIIQGLLQSRAIRVSAILMPNSEPVALPAHCIEESRFSYTSSKGAKYRYHLHSQLRASNIQDTYNSEQNIDDYVSWDSQDRTWGDIRKLRENKERSLGRSIDNTGDFIGDLYELDETTIAQYIDSFCCPDTATGLIAIINQSSVAMDAFADSRLFNRNYKAIVSGLAVEAINTEVAQRNEELSAQSFLRSILKAKKKRNRAIGSGINLRFYENNVIGSALITDDVYHVEAFSV